MKIKEEPVKILALKNSDKISHPKKAANIASVLIIIAASFGGEYLCPIICSTKAIHTDPIEQYSKVIKTRGFTKRFGKLNNSYGENKKPKMIKTIDANKNCNIANNIIGFFLTPYEST